MSLPKFKSEILTFSEMRNLRAGSSEAMEAELEGGGGTTRSTRSFTKCTGSDSDGKRADSD